MILGLTLVTMNDNKTRVYTQGTRGKNVLMRKKRYKKTKFENVFKTDLTSAHEETICVYRGKKVILISSTMVIHKTLYPRTFF